MESFYVLILPSIHYVMKVEKDALATGISVELVPTPRQISSDCGMAVKFREMDLEWIIKEMNAEGMPEGILFRAGVGGFECLGPARDISP